MRIKTKPIAIVVYLHAPLYVVWGLTGLVFINQAFNYLTRLIKFRKIIILLTKSVINSETCACANWFKCRTLCMYQSER